MDHSYLDSLQEIYAGRKQELLLSLSLRELTLLSAAYFQKNACLAGQKTIKEVLFGHLLHLKKHPDWGLSPDEEVAKAFLARSMAEIAITTAKVGNLKISPVTKANKDDFSVLKPPALPLKHFGCTPENPFRHYFLADARVRNRTVFCGGYEIGLLSEGFGKNHPDADAPAVLILTDYSACKFACISCHVIVDLMDNLEMEVTL